MHEVSLWPESSFVTLTYRPECLPLERGIPTLRPRDFVLFMKRLRKQRAPVGVRFVQAGEYGELGRPHHHALLFNCGFRDLVFLRKTRAGSMIFRSAELEGLWPYGFSSVGLVTFESAAYVARYTLKKQGSESSLSGRSKRCGGRLPEYMTMSRRPGIGAGWFERFASDVFPVDRVVLRGGRVMRPPRFYDERFKVRTPEAFEAVKLERQRRVAGVDPQEMTPSRLRVKAEVLKRRIDELKRGF